VTCGFYELRAKALPENVAPFPVILAYHQRMMALAERGELTLTEAREIMFAQGMMSIAIRDAVEDFNREHGSSPPGQDSGDEATPTA
jgi:hypothetical protein